MQNDEQAYLKQVGDLVNYREEFLHIKQEQWNTKLEFWNSVLSYFVVSSCHEVTFKYFKMALKDSNCFLLKKKFFDWCLLTYGIEGAQEASQM